MQEELRGVQLVISTYISLVPRAVTQPFAGSLDQICLGCCQLKDPWVRLCEMSAVSSYPLFFILLLLFIIFCKTRGSAGNRTRATCTRSKYFTAELRSLISYILSTSWVSIFCFLFLPPSLDFFEKKGHNRIRTNDHGNCSPMLYHWAMRPPIYPYVFPFPCFILLSLSFKKTPPVGLEPTTLRLKAARSTDWARKALNIIL